MRLAWATSRRRSFESSTTRKTHDLDGPSTLVFAETGRLLQVHRGRALGDGKVGLLSFGDDEAPRVGESADLTVWWIPGAWPMLRDATGWRQAVISEDDFCLLTYDTLEEGVVASTDDDGHWISVSAWETYVRDDLLRLRTVAW
jgi:hypothetical protein